MFYGFLATENIVKILLENGADATMKNRKHQSPIHMAQNMRVQRILQNAAEEFELQPFSAFVSILLLLVMNESIMYFWLSGWLVK